jgi:hypothetical protein
MLGRGRKLARFARCTVAAAVVGAAWDLGISPASTRVPATFLEEPKAARAPDATRVCVCVSTPLDCGCEFGCVRDVDADTERVAFDRGRVPPLAGVFIVLPVGFEDDDDEAECALPDLVTLLGGSAVRALFAADPRSSAGRTAGVTPTLVTDLMGMYPGCGVVPLVGGAEPAREEPVVGAGPEPKVEGACFRLFEGAGAAGAAAAAAVTASACSCSGSELSNRSRIRSLWTRNALPCASSHAVKAFCRSFSSYNELASVSHK